MELDNLSPGVQNIILGVVANGVTAILGCVCRQTLTQIAGETNQPVGLDELLKTSINEVAETIDWPESQRLEEVCLFLCSPEVEEFVRQIYAVRLLDDSPDNSLDAIRRQFVAFFSACVGVKGKSIEESGKLLLDALVAGCDKMLEANIDRGHLTAHEARSNLRFRILRDEIAAVQRNNESHRTGELIQLESLLEFDRSYRRQVVNRHKYLVPPHLDSIRRVLIDEMFVEPSLTSMTEDDGDVQITLGTAEFLSTLYRAVVLGNPGAGKSTLSVRICHSLSSEYASRRLAGRQATPILVVLKDYGADKKRRKTSIVDFIEATINSTYQVKPPPGAIEHMLLNGRACVIFDGLDELLDTAYRAQVSSDIESFCELYPAVPVLVTSREVGYEQAPLDEQIFSVFRLAPFNDEQVSEYAHKWFRVETDLSSEQSTAKALGFLNESQFVPDLRTSPLMLGLMCSIYRGDGYIPTNRPDVYEKCALLLYDRWDKFRGITASRPFEAHIRPAIMHLAYWIYGSDTLQSGVTERELILKTTEYLSVHRYDDYAEAELAAERFVEFCRGRAWVFTDTGTTRNGERLYQFTHRTFLEFFAAAQLVRTHPTPDALARVLIPKIERREWDVVAQLAIQLLNRNVEFGGDEVLYLVIQGALEGESAPSWNLVSFAVRCLEFMVPSPKATKLVTCTFLEHCFTWAEGRTPASFFRVTSTSSRDEGLESLLYCAHENRGAVSAALEHFVYQQAYREDSQQRNCLACELSSILQVFVHGGRASSNMAISECDVYWSDVSSWLGDALLNSRAKCAAIDLFVARISYIRGEISLYQLVKLHGLLGVICSVVLQMRENMRHVSIAEAYLHNLQEVESAEIFVTRHQQACRFFSELGGLVLETRSPLASGLTMPRNFRQLRVSRDLAGLVADVDVSNLDRDVVFGMMCILWMAIEVHGHKPERVLEPSVQKCLGKLNSPAITSGHQASAPGGWEATLANAGFNNKQASYFSGWLQQEVSLLAHDIDDVKTWPE